MDKLYGVPRILSLSFDTCLGKISNTNTCIGFSAGHWRLEEALLRSQAT